MKHLQARLPLDMSAHLKTKRQLVSKSEFTLQFICEQLHLRPDDAVKIASLGLHTFENENIICYCCILPFRELDAPGPQWPIDLVPQSNNAWFHLIASNAIVDMKAIIKATLTDGRFTFPLNVFARIANPRLWRVMKRLYNALPHPDYPHIIAARIESPDDL